MRIHSKEIDGILVGFMFISYNMIPKPVDFS